MATTRTEQTWLDSVRTLVLRGDPLSAQAELAKALSEYPESVDLRRTRAGVLLQTGQAAAAEQIFDTLLTQNPGDAGSAFALAQMLKDQGRTLAAATVLRACLAAASNAHNPDLAIAAIERLGDIGHFHDAAAIAESAIAAHPDDSRLHAYAGMLAIQLGEFESAREQYLVALEHDPRAFEWHVPIGLASSQCYQDASHPDFAIFRNALEREDLSVLARAELHFSLGKACNDIGDYSEAALHFREGNAIRRREANWSRESWRHMIKARLAATPILGESKPLPSFTPILIVGMPRSGTTLLAELLSKYPQVRNRGELATLAHLAAQPAMDGIPDQATLDRAAIRYTQQARQDDAPDAHWFIDKQPLNFRYVDLALGMFPDAKVVYCRRNPRDTALSLWMQCFLEDVQGYSYDFDDIALVMRDCEKLMAKWLERYPDSIRTVRYEDLVASAQHIVAALAAWVGIPNAAFGTVSMDPPSGNAISTASLWQARQPVNTRSVDRWVHYITHVPELSRLAER